MGGSTGTCAAGTENIRGGTPEQARAGIVAQGIDLFMVEAMFTSSHEIRVIGDILGGKRFIIATGTTAFIPEIEGLSATCYITNVEAVSLPELPKRLVVIGGGPIGLEFAQMFSRFGVQVDIARIASDEARTGTLEQLFLSGVRPVLVLALTLAGACGLGFAILYHFQVYNPAWPDVQPYDTLFFAITAIIIVSLNRRWIFRR